MKQSLKEVRNKIVDLRKEAIKQKENVRSEIITGYHEDAVHGVVAIESTTDRKAFQYFINIEETSNKMLSKIDELLGR